MMKSLNKLFVMSALSTGLMLSVSMPVEAQTTTSAPSVPALTMPCSQDAMNAIAAESNRQVQEAHKLQDPIIKNILQQPTDANGASAMSLMQQCVGTFWPGGSFRMPTLQDLINAAKEYIAQQCGNLRNKISQSLPSMQGASISTGIPGLPNIGYSAGVSQGSSSVWTVNGQNPTTGIGNIGSSNTPLTGSGLTSGLSSTLPSSTYTSNTTPVVPPNTDSNSSNSSNSNSNSNNGNPSSPVDKLKCLLGGC